jgi:hypothetical protein
VLHSGLAASPNVHATRRSYAVDVSDETPASRPPSRAEVLADGTEDLDSVVVDSVTRPCPCCGTTCGFDAVAIARDGEPVGWGRSPETLRLQDRILTCLPFEVGMFDGARTMAGTDGVLPRVGRSRCTACLVELLVVVSHGEVQPARYRLVLDGVIAAGDG